MFDCKLYSRLRIHVLAMHLTLLLIHNSIPHRSASVAAHPAFESSTGNSLGRRQAPPSTVNSNEINDCLDPNNTPRETRVQSCKPKNVLDAQGNCGPLVNYGDDGLQAAFCQVDIRWDYGQEVDLNLNCACSDDKCSITTTQSTQVTNTFAFNVGGNLKHRSPEPATGLQGLRASDLMNIFNAGAIWSYSSSFTNSTAASSTKPTIASGKCGYWTFVPFFVTICGTLSWQTTTHPLTGHALASVSQTIPTSGVNSTGGWCQTTAYTDAHGEPIGKTVFVATNCYTDTILPFCWQDPTYLSSGVSKDPSVYNDYLDVHENFDFSAPVESTPLIECELGHAPFSQGEIYPGCVAGLPSGVPLSPAYTSS